LRVTSPNGRDDYTRRLPNWQVKNLARAEFQSAGDHNRIFRWVAIVPPRPAFVVRARPIQRSVRSALVFSHRSARLAQPGIAASVDAALGVLTFNGTPGIATYQSLLQSVTYADTSESPDESPRTITFTSDDGINTNHVGSASRVMIVDAQNDAPVLVDDAVLPAVLQATADPPGRKVVALFAGLVADSDPRAYLSGIAVVANAADPAAEGSWQYSTDDGTTWYDIVTVGDDATALALSAATRIRFLPVATFTGRPNPRSVRALDDTFAGSFTAGAARRTLDPLPNGGTTAVSAAPAGIGTTVFASPVGGNTPPTLSGVPISANIDELTTRTFTAQATDPYPGQALARRPPHTTEQPLPSSGDETVPESACQVKSVFPRALTYR
jgi:hypothetical protein